MTSSSTDIAIDRCYCEDKPFRYLIDIARRDRIDLRELAQQEGCGTHCGWCVAYLRRALCTGQTVFHELLDKESLDNR
ncbi:MAG: (2Fe-2S)-binding protein [Aggregatilineales bacterium]